MTERYTQTEVVRILGLDRRQLKYWERLQLVRPRARWGERFYSFGDLVALETIKSLTERKVPASRLRRAVAALQQEMGHDNLSIEQIRVVDHGRNVAIMIPGVSRQPFDPLSRQWLFPFEARKVATKVHEMQSRTAEEWFELALECESRPELLSEAIFAYQHVVELSPDWIEAHLNLGVVHYQLAEWEEAREAFQTAIELDPANPFAQYNMGCVLEELGEVDLAIVHLKRTIRVIPTHADAHFNLALAYERKAEYHRAKEHWTAYLRYAPNGEWASTARARLANLRNAGKQRMPIPFPRKRS